MELTKEEAKLEDELSIKLYRNGKLVEKRHSKEKSRLVKILEFLLSFFG